MKKALNLLLGLSLMASAYAKSPAFKPTIASLPPAPISPTGSIALQADTTYVFLYYYDSYDNPDNQVTLYFTSENGAFAYPRYAPVAFTIDVTSGPLDGYILSWPEGQESLTFYLSAPPSGDYTATIAPNTLNGYPVAQGIYD